MIISLVFQLIGLALVLLIIAAALSPFEAMSWWAGWSDYAKSLDDVEEKAASEPDVAALAPADQYAVFLSGIGTMGGENLDGDEQAFADRLTTLLPGTVVVQDVFPYSVNNNALTGQRVFAWFWKRLEQFRISGQHPMLVFLINLRNLFQVAVSSDRRYGPMYNHGSAEVILTALLRHGYPSDSGTPVILMGSSGGGQISLGASAYLKAQLNAPIWIISIGGVMSSDPSVLHAEHVYHLHGSKDSVDELGKYVFPGRWPVMKHSPWNHALDKGKITFVTIGPMAHMGTGWYFCRQTQLEDGQSHLDHTAMIVATLIAHFTRGQVPAPQTLLALEKRKRADLQ